MTSTWLTCFMLVSATDFVGVHGHGYLTEPPARNIRQGEYCPQCGNGWGVCGHRPGGQWPDSPNYLDVFEGVRKTYIAGQTVDFKVTVTAHHRGHFEFSICDHRINSSMQDPLACLRQWPLQRASPQDSYPECKPNDDRADCQPLDTAYPERWYLPPPGDATQTYTMRFVIPADLECSECTLQWRWWTANSCVPKQGYGCFFDSLAAAGWSAASWCGAFCGQCPTDTTCGDRQGEEFKNCADIRVQRPASSPEPSAEATTSISTSEPTQSPGLSELPDPEPEGEEEEEEEVHECRAVPGHLQAGATDVRCSRACAHLDGILGSVWPCRPGDVCICTSSTSAPGSMDSTSSELPLTSSVAPSSPPAAATTPAALERLCLHQTDCSLSAWCDQPGYEVYCAENGKLDYCPSPYCYWGPRGGSFVETAPCVTGGCLAKAAAAASLVQVRKYEQRLPAQALLDLDDQEKALRCHADVLNDIGATDSLCALTCGALPLGWWPCGEGGPCVCSAFDEAAPSPIETTPASEQPSTLSATTVAPATPAAPSPHSPSPPIGESLLADLLHALEASDSSNVFMYNDGTSLQPSDLYTWTDMILAVRLMATRGVGQAKLWVGEGQNHVYGLVNIAAFLAQCMQETIQYNACDENNWSNDAVTQQAGGTAYSATAACGQMEQSYQNYVCSAEEDATAGGQMACPVDVNMQARAMTKAGWYGAPPQLFCAPRSKVPKSPRWDHADPGWCSETPFPDTVDLDTYFSYVNDAGSCKDASDIKAGGWTFDGCSADGCKGSPAPLFGVPEGRSDVEGCCWWGRGVIQTTGVCNYGKLNYYLGKRASDEGREALFPDTDFCSDPGAICAPDSPPELKWVAGFFYWLNAVQTYTASGWQFQEELKQWVDSGLNLADARFIDGVSGIVNRGCHNPPNCGTGHLHGGMERRENFKTVLRAMKLVG